MKMTNLAMVIVVPVPEVDGLGYETAEAQ